MPIPPFADRSAGRSAAGFVLAAALVASFALPSLAGAEEACKMEMNVAPMTLSAMYARAEKIARSWNADMVPARLGNTSLGPLEASGKSAAWHLVFYSPRAKKSLTIQTFNGMFTCWADDGEPGRIPDLAPGFLVDSGKLYAFAREHGASLLAEGYTVSIQTAAAPESRHATWYVTFEKENRSGGLSIVVDANTGKLEQALRH